MRSGYRGPQVVTWGSKGIQEVSGVIEGYMRLHGVRRG